MVTGRAVTNITRCSNFSTNGRTSQHYWALFEPGNQGSEKQLPQIVLKLARYRRKISFSG